jgi:RNA polymerase sigma-70 factor, ECF subfamily
MIMAAVPADAEIILRVLAGDHKLFTILVRRHHEAMLRACRAIVGEIAEAEDVVQSAWIRAYRSLASFRADGAFRTWVTRIALNEAFQILRIRRRHRFMRPLEHASSSREVTTPEDSMIARELGALLEHELDALPRDMRVIVVLRDVLELDTAETAACLGIEAKTVRVRLHRARRRLAASCARNELLEMSAKETHRDCTKKGA